jgi:Zn-finger nucleic acid-binding protein
MQLACPRCAVTMYVGRTPAGASMHGCGQCGGVWLDNATAQHVIDTVCEHTLQMAQSAAGAASQPGTRPAAKLLSCPVCGQTMTAQRVQKAWLDIDVCAEHGTWYDYGELEKVARATQRDLGDWRSQPAPAPPLSRNPEPVVAAAAMSPDTAEIVTDVAVEVGGFAIFALIEALFD